MNNGFRSRLSQGHLRWVTARSAQCRTWPLKVLLHHVGLLNLPLLCRAMALYTKLKPYRQEVIIGELHYSVCIYLCHIGNMIKVLLYHCQPSNDLRMHIKQTIKPLYAPVIYTAKDFSAHFIAYFLN